jgi:ferredoxin
MVRKEFRTGATLGEGEVPQDLTGCVQEAADLCPVQIIHLDI